MGSTGIMMIGIRKARRYQRGISEDVHRRTEYTMFKGERTKRQTIIRHGRGGGGRSSCPTSDTRLVTGKRHGHTMVLKPCFVTSECKCIDNKKNMNP